MEIKVKIMIDSITVDQAGNWFINLPFDEYLGVSVPVSTTQPSDNLSFEIETDNDQVPKFYLTLNSLVTLHNIWEFYQKQISQIPSDLS